MRIEILLPRTVLAVACGLAIGACGSKAPETQRGSAPAGAEQRAPSRKRLFLEGYAEDDEARAERLAELIRGEKVRCKRADKVAMVSSGVWTVRCQEGAVFRVIFDREAKLVEARKISD
jgi:hypothetical protein